MRMSTLLFWGASVAGATRRLQSQQLLQRSCCRTPCLPLPKVSLSACLWIQRTVSTEHFRSFVSRTASAASLESNWTIRAMPGSTTWWRGSFGSQSLPSFMLPRRCLLPIPPPYERRCKKLPWAEHSLSVAIVVERTLMKVEPGGGAKGTKFLELVDQQQQVAAAYDRLPAP